MSESPSNCCQDKLTGKARHIQHACGSSPIYGLGVIGALFYFLQGASGFTPILTGIFKAVFWPAVLMFELLTYLQL